MHGHNVVIRLGYVDCVMYLLDASGEYFIQMAAHGPKNPVALDIKNPIKIKMGEGIVGTVGMTGKAEIVHDTTCDARYIMDDEMRCSEITVPITNSFNKVIGVIDSEHPHRNFFTPADLEILTTIASITAIKLLQATSQERLQSVREDLKQLVYTAAHDLKEPLRMIGCYSNLLEKNYAGQLDDQGLEFLHFLTEGSKNMDILVQDLLSYIHLSSEQPHKQVDCNEVMGRVLTNLHVAVQENGAQIHCSELPVVWGHFSQLMQMFQNLVSNAIKYRSEAPPVIHIYAKYEYRQYLFSITDNGIGIDPEHFDKIFKIFYKLHPKREYGGTGIGLATCKKIVENFKGRIWVESGKGQGSTFHFTIPR